MDTDFKDNLKQQSTWMRGLYMLLFAIFYSLAEIILVAIAIFQFLLTLFSGSTNPRLLKLGQGLSTYMYQILQFVTFNSDYQPYPFGAWPNGKPGTGRSKASNEVIEQETNVDGD